MQTGSEANSSDVRMELGSFENGSYCLWVHFADEDVEKVSITPCYVDNLTKSQDCPKHVAFGNMQGENGIAFQAVVKGDFTSRLKKLQELLDFFIYLFDDKFNAHLDEIAVGFWFQACGKMANLYLTTSRNLSQPLLYPNAMRPSNSTSSPNLPFLVLHHQKPMVPRSSSNFLVFQRFLHQKSMLSSKSSSSLFPIHFFVSI